MTSSTTEADAAAAGDAPAAQHAAPPRSRTRRVALLVWPALAVYAASTAAHLLLLSAMIPAGGPSLRNRLTTWDGGFYLDIATHGYPHGFSYDPSGKLTGNTLAFFPLYPMLVRAVHEVTRLDIPMAGIVTANLALIAALIVVLQLFTRLYGRRTAVVAIVLLAGAQPMALVFLMSYSESLFLALAAGMLLAAHRRAWLTAGLLALLVGLTRPAAVAAVVALGVAVLLHLVRERRISWRPLAALVLGCAGTPLYLLWVALRVGRVDAWFQIQGAGWGTQWDNGRAIWDFLVQTLATGDGWVPVSTAVLLIALVCATLVTWQRGSWPPLVVYGTSIVVLTLCQSNYYHSKLRLLLPALVFLVPLARSIARTRSRTAVLTLAAATVFGCWYGAYMITVWSYAI
ncbi:MULTISPECIES: hypothetical protein [Streptacidiphilus]|uniref:Glycosyltransferase RgtA/B/C/D-like domain-containing protein n=1 Tax=Streptacidiphilus cavernicola TaxID=3342716 RepID=A0ABV6UJQ6_9ACTN|nr:hypothetical protein [Streptacidiphilus jeojiense]